jgi:hypothetical protein
MAEPYNRPLPVKQPESDFYWEKAKAHELWVCKCNACGRAFFYPRAFCPFSPRPEKEPLPLPSPRPMRRRALREPGAGLISWGLDYRVDRARRDVTVTLFGLEKGLGNLVQGIRPGNVLPVAAALGALAPQGPEQSGRMMNTLGITADLFADDASRIAVGLCATHAADRMAVEEFDL